MNASNWLLTSWLISTLTISLTAQAQDPQFSQFHANPVYHNPAFAGGAGMNRFGVTHRIQWPGLPVAYQTTSAFADVHYQPNGWGTSLGGALLATYQEVGNQVSSTSVALPLSVSIPLHQDGGRETRLTVGIQPGWLSQRLGTDGLTFVDQYGVGGLVNGPTRDPIALAGLTRNRFDLALGGLLEQRFGNEQALVWVGLTAHHVGASINNVVNNSDWVNQRLGVQGGVVIPMPEWQLWTTGLGYEHSRDKQAAFTAYYRQQGPMRQLDLGVNVTYSPLMVGLWYRGMLPPQQDALIGIVGWQWGRIMLEYSHDFTISSLAGATAGSHEFTLWVGLDDDLFRFKGDKNTPRRQRECFQY